MPLKSRGLVVCDEERQCKSMVSDIGQAIAFFLQAIDPRVLYQ